MTADPKAGKAIEAAHESPTAGALKKPAGAHRARRAAVGGSVPRETSRLTQRWRLIQAMIELSGKAGFHEVSIAQLCAGAGVSQATFYEQFADQEDVLVGAYRASAEGIFGQMSSAVAGSEISEVPRLALGALLQAVASDPGAARVLFIDSLGGGERMLQERARAFGRFERRAEEFLAHTARDTGTLDVPVSAVVGALRDIVSRHLRTHSEDELPALLDDGLAWLYSYARAPGAESWSRSQKALLQTPPVAPSSPAQGRPPERLPPGRHGLPASLVARHQRTRIIFATAEVTMAKGYANTTIEDIVAAARVAKPVFYRYFTDKQHAFLEAQQHPPQHILDSCAKAYFSEEHWPERVWSMLETLLSLIVANPAMSHLRLVECYAAGPAAIRRAEEITRSVTIFLEEGYGYPAKARSLPRLSSQAIAGAIFEIIQRLVAEGRAASLPAHLPLLTYIAIAPFTGAEEAIGLVQEIMAGRAALQARA